MTDYNVTVHLIGGDTVTYEGANHTEVSDNGSLMIFEEQELASRERLAQHQGPYSKPPPRSRTIGRGVHAPGTWRYARIEPFEGHSDY